MRVARLDEIKLLWKNIWKDIDYERDKWDCEEGRRWWMFELLALTEEIEGEWRGIMVPVFRKELGKGWPSC